MATVFISYSHKDDAWKKQLATHLKSLEIEGFYQSWDDAKIAPGSNWRPEIETALNQAQVAVMLISADFLASQFITEVEVPLILKRRQEQGLIVLPVIVRPCSWKKIQWLLEIQHLPKGDKALSEMQPSEIDRALAGVAQTVCDCLGNRKKPAVLSGAHISLYKLPVTGDRFVGREKELKILDDAWADGQTDILTLVAWGGVGKTALVNQWLNLMRTDNYRGAQKVYGWSFYSQGAKSCRDVARNVSTTTASADEFFQETLQWFGDANPETGSTVDKGRRLARLARQEKTLLILDGLEPLQYPPGEIHGFNGKLKDAGLAAFLKELACGCPGGGGEKPGSGAQKVLCVITTREPVTDLLNRKGYGVKEIQLEHLSEEAGKELLKSLGVTIGSQKDFHDAVTEYGGHALALTLLGQYIANILDGDIRRRDEIVKSSKGKIKEGHHAQKVMEAYMHWLGNSPERDILYIIGLFDRPVEAGAIEALKKEPAIPGVTDKLQGISAADWQMALSNLRNANLLARESPQKKGTLDCHPLVREYFGEKLRQENPAGWKKAHERLYRYFKDLPEKKLPDTLAEMEPLFAAVAHGCRAGLHQEALDEVYWKRISRTKEFYSTSKLGAFGSDLVCLSHFFAFPWGELAVGLPDVNKALVLSWAAFRLRALGRLREAVQPMKAGLGMGIQQSDWMGAA
ncbi:MAG: toll/interleukin-1 receptor domain-containing protein [Candidatus Aminicenantes bacterium]|nr:toll/interleukin-1 receptor domain-containing protein [Candidatus Aminicenantes bacterium]